LRWQVEVARRVRGGEEGQGLVEYVLITAVLAVGALLALQALSGGITGVLTRVAGRLAAVG
jgi:Flp pilus assembly pilin Flp